MRRRPHLLFLPYLIFVLGLSCMVHIFSHIITCTFLCILLYTFSFSDLSNSILEKNFQP